MSNEKSIRPTVAGGELVEEIAGEIAEWFGRAVAQPDRELALIIINRIRREPSIDSDEFDATCGPVPEPHFSHGSMKPKS